MAFGRSFEKIVLAWIACQALGCVAASSGVGRRERLRIERELEEKEASLLAAHSRSQDLANLNELLRFEGAEHGSSVEASQAEAQSLQEIIGWVNAQREMLVRENDRLENQYDRLNDDNSGLRELSQRLSTALDLRGREFHDLEENVLLGTQREQSSESFAPETSGGSSASSRRYLTREMAEQLRRLRIVEERILAQPIDGEPGEAVEAESVYALYRGDPVGLWRENRGLIGERLGSLLRGGARWDALDFCIFSLALLLLVACLWACGLPLRWLARRREQRELRMLRRAVRESESQAESARPIARMTLPRHVMTAEPRGGAGVASMLGDEEVMDGDVEAEISAAFEKLEEFESRDGGSEGEFYEAQSSGTQNPEGAESMEPVDATDDDDARARLLGDMETSLEIQASEPSHPGGFGASYDDEEASLLEGEAPRETALIQTQATDVDSEALKVGTDTSSFDKILSSSSPRKSRRRKVAQEVDKPRKKSDSVREDPSIVEDETTSMEPVDLAHLPEPESNLGEETKIETSSSLEDTKMQDTAVHHTQIMDAPSAVEELREQMNAEKLDEKETRKVEEIDDLVALIEDADEDAIEDLEEEIETKMTDTVVQESPESLSAAAALGADKTANIRKRKSPRAAVVKSAALKKALGRKPAPASGRGDVYTELRELVGDRFEALTK